jgi:hypothetical protein
LWLTVATLFAAARAAPPTAVPVDGDPFAARLSAVNASWRITFDASGREKVLAAEDLVRWGDCPDVSPSPLLILADGSLLVADLIEADGQTVLADSVPFGLLKLRAEWVAAVVFHPALDRLARDRLLDRAAKADARSDRLLLANGDLLSGRCEAIVGDTIRMATDVAPLEIEAHRARALFFSPLLLDRATAKHLHLLAGFADGSRLVADRLVVDKGQVQVTTSAGFSCSSDSVRPVYLQVRQGPRVRYLSDLPAAGYGRVAFLDLPWPYAADRNLLGGRLRADGRLYLEGLAMHSASRLTYLLEARYRRFEALLAIDDLAGGRGSVRYRVFVDAEEKFASPVVRGGRPPLPLSVDVTGAPRLDLVVDFADRADEQDHADWLDARLVR